MPGVPIGATDGKNLKFDFFAHWWGAILVPLAPYYGSAGPPNRQGRARLYSIFKRQKCGTGIRTRAECTDFCRQTSAEIFIKIHQFSKKQYFSPKIFEKRGN